MRGHAVYFYMLKDDLIESFKRIEEKFGGLQYALDTTYKVPKLKIYNSIEELPNIGIITPIEPHYYIALKNESFTIEAFQKTDGSYNYYVEDKLGCLQFFPSGIFENSNCIKRGEINTVTESDSRLILFKELKKSILKNSMKINRGISTYVGKLIIENKEKYRIPYGSPASPPEDDFDISDMVWREKGNKKENGV